MRITLTSEKASNIHHSINFAQVDTDINDALKIKVFSLCRIPPVFYNNDDFLFNILNLRILSAGFTYRFFFANFKFTYEVNWLILNNKIAREHYPLVETSLPLSNSAERVVVEGECFSEVVFQKQPLEVFCKKVVLRNFAKFTGKYLCHGLFFNKVVGLRQSVFLEILQSLQENTCARASFLTKLQKRVWHRYFLVDFVKFLRTPFLQNTSGDGLCRLDDLIIS